MDESVGYTALTTSAEAHWLLGKLILIITCQYIRTTHTCKVQLIFFLSVKAFNLKRRHDSKHRVIRAEQGRHYDHHH